MTSAIEWMTGVTLFLFGLSFVLSPTDWARSMKRLLTDTSQRFTLLLVFLILGLLIVNGHNLWVADWRVLVTVVGWATVLKTAAVLIHPKLLQKYADLGDDAMAMGLRLGGFIWLVGGAAITYLSLR